MSISGIYARNNSHFVRIISLKKKIWNIKSKKTEIKSVEIEIQLKDTDSIVHLYKCQSEKPTPASSQAPPPLILLLLLQLFLLPPGLQGSKLTLAGKGCKTTPSSRRPASARWGYCLRLEPVSYMDMARPPRGACRLGGPCSGGCPLGVCHRRLVFSVCRLLSCRGNKASPVSAEADLVTADQPDINNRAEGGWSCSRHLSTSLLLIISFQSCCFFSFSFNLKTRGTDWVQITSADVNCWEKMQHKSPYLHHHQSRTAKTDDVPPLSV